MKRLLVVITRMYVGRGEDGDEFTEVWGEEEDADKDHLLFPAQQGEHGRMVLAVHGHDYPEALNAEVVRRAADEIKAGMGGAPKMGLEVGVAFHPPLAWDEAQTGAFAHNLTAALVADAYAVKFVTDYRNGSLLQRELAPLCSSGQDFAAAFDRSWEKLGDIATAAPDSRMGYIRHRLVNKLSPLERELSEWRALGYEDEFGQAMLKAHARAANTLGEARDLVGKQSWNEHSVANVAQSVTVLMKDAAEKGKVEQALNTLTALFQTHASFQKVKEIVDFFGRDPADYKTSLKTLEGLLTEKNHFKEWYDAVFKAFDDLRKTLGS